jgi:hypothetical protein
MTRIDQWAPVAFGLNQQIYLGTELLFTAADAPVRPAVELMAFRPLRSARPQRSLSYEDIMIGQARRHCRYDSHPPPIFAAGIAAG